MKILELSFFMFFGAVTVLGFSNYFYGTLKSYAGTREKLIKAPIESNSIEWQTSFDRSLEFAKKTKKPIMADFYADWCGWCRKLDETTYQDNNVIELSKRFICVKVNTDADIGTSSKYNVSGLPTIVFFSYDGKVTKKVVGYRPGDYFRTVMEELTKK
ncbi:MAG: thioredoxin family protein [Elusimicrobia bacterium]|nr:thioredoxin family protein [Candidatus Liberimonas magnetica]